MPERAYLIENNELHISETNFQNWLQLKGISYLDFLQDCEKENPGLTFDGRNSVQDEINYLIG